MAAATFVVLPYIQPSLERNPARDHLQLEPPVRSSRPLLEPNPLDPTIARAQPARAEPARAKLQLEPPKRSSHRPLKPATRSNRSPAEPPTLLQLASGFMTRWMYSPPEVRFRADLVIGSSASPEYLISISHENSTLYPLTSTVNDVEVALDRRPSATDGPGVVYWFRIVNEDHSTEYKAGRTNCVPRRLGEWEKQCNPSTFEVIAEIQTQYAKKLEAESVVHRYFKVQDCWILPYPCSSCGVRHREKFEIDGVGGIEVVREITESLGRLVDGEYE
ncbi:hypothetical protein R3P38DRAFT_3168456 [Favolaschia claudopus]|uniref:Bacteriophage T5 Orf172 DNA-binding domain-containing protein n=1 Tax=Favolaschia claudopus TaxID=2862362 RepID=A0AAW0EAB9_9AGAR